MKVSLLVVLAFAVSALDTSKPPKEKLKVLGSGPHEVCEVPRNFVRKVSERSTRKWEGSVSGDVTLEEPKLEKIFYINLDKSVERRKEIEEGLNAQFDGIPVERWRATGKDVAGKLKWTDYSKKGRQGGTGIGSVATWFSHYFLIKHISEQPDPNAVFLVFEDDVIMNRKNLKDDVMCQIKQLPADWDIFKFGYWGYRMSVNPGKVGYPACDHGYQINPYTCAQSKFAWNYMGNQGYALRPGGAKAMIEHLKNEEIYDVDGAMMPGGTSGKWTDYSHPNTYVSKHTLVQHWQGRHTSTRTNGGDRGYGANTQLKADLKEKKKEKKTAELKSEEEDTEMYKLTPEEEDKADRLEKEDSLLELDIDGRETGGMQYKRLMAWKENVLDKYEVNNEVNV